MLVIQQTSTYNKKNNFRLKDLKMLEIKTTKKKKILFISALCLGLVLVIGWDFYRQERPQENITLYGNVDIRQVNMAFRVSGRLKNMRFEEGDVIQKGDIVATLDDEPVLNKLNQAKAQLEQAKVQRDNAERRYKRNIELCKTDTISQQECDNILAARDEAVANVSYVESVLAEAQTAYDDTKLYAPANGVMLVRIQEPGSMLAAGSPVYTLSLNEEMWARTYIKETDLGRFKIGTPVEIMTDSTPTTYQGHIGFISPQAEFTPKNIETTSLRTDLVYRARIIIDNPDDYLKQGMPITIKVK